MKPLLPLPENYLEKPPQTPPSEGFGEAFPLNETGVHYNVFGASILKTAY